MSSIQKTKIFLSFFTLFFIFASPALAAGIHLELAEKTVSLNQDFIIQLFLDTEGRPANAIEGKILFDQDILEIQEINDGNSILNFWVEKPHLESDGSIVFSGIIPGGFNGERGLVLNLLFGAKGLGRSE